jgi:hypothetical protein
MRESEPYAEAKNWQIDNLHRDLDRVRHELDRCLNRTEAVENRLSKRDFERFRNTLYLECAALIGAVVALWVVVFIKHH